MLFQYLMYIGVAALTISSTDAATNVNKRSTCRETPAFENFNITRHLGHWYIHSHHQHDFEAGCDCLTSDVIAIDPTSLRISLCCQKTHITDETQECSLSVNYANLTDPEKKDARFMFTREGVTLESPLWIIDTDYENYAVINGCDGVNNDEELLWILTRARVVSETIWGKIEAVLKAHNFEKNKIAHQRHGTDVCKSQRPHREHTSRHGSDSKI